MLLLGEKKWTTSAKHSIDLNAEDIALVSVICCNFLRSHQVFDIRKSDGMIEKTVNVCIVRMVAWFWRIFNDDICYTHGFGVWVLLIKKMRRKKIKTSFLAIWKSYFILLFIFFAVKAHVHLRLSTYGLNASSAAHTFSGPFEPYFSD